MEKRNLPLLRVQIDTVIMENSTEIPYKQGVNLPRDSAMPLLGIYPEKHTVLKDTCTPVFIAALFTIARTWVQPIYPSLDEWIKKLWYIYTMKY